MDGEGEQGGGGVLKESNTDFFKDSWTFLFTLCLIRCPFTELPVVGRRVGDTHLHKAEVFAALLKKRRGRVSERQGWMERGETRCEESNYEFSA